MFFITFYAFQVGFESLKYSRQSEMGTLCTSNKFCSGTVSGSPQVD